jgi:hypothetical protein
VTRDFRGELEELRLFGPVIEEGPGGAGCSQRGRLRQVVSEPRILCFCSREEEKT